MPSISTYTPLESLLFFQSIASLGATANAFSTISELLTKNDFIRRDESFNNERLAPAALQELYTTLLNEEATRQNRTNGFTESPQNTRKRKLSSPSRHNSATAAKDPKFWSALIDRLYGEYRDHAVAAIQSEESKYDALKLQLQQANATQSQPSAKTTEVTLSQDAVVAQAAGGRSPGALPDKSESGRPEATTVAPRKAEQNGELAKHAGDPEAPKGDPARPKSIRDYVLGNDTTERKAGQREVAASPHAVSSEQQATPAPTGTSGTKSLKPAPPGARIAPSPSPGPLMNSTGMSAPSPSPLRGATATPGQPGSAVHPGMPYPPNMPMYPHYPPPPPHGYPPQQWPQQGPQHAQHPLRGSPYAQPPPMQQDFSGRTPIMARSPQPPHVQAQYAQYPYPPGPYNGMPPYPHQASPMTPIAPYPLPPHLASGLSTPVAGRNAMTTPHARKSLGRSPWKNTPSTTKSELPRPPSREVSPIPERLSFSDEAGPGANDAQGSRTSMRKPEHPARRARNGSASPSGADRSRSMSIMSHASDAQPPRGRKKIKNEPPSTPVPISDSVETDQQRSSTRRKRGNTLTGPGQPRPPFKRKRGDSVEAEEASQTPRPSAPEPVRPIVDQDKVYATRNFARICGPIMNDVTAHKHAGIFAKPLTERDAPGYKSLIYRPSDLKTIKSMIHAGTKAVNAALEEVATASTSADGGTASPAVNTPTSSTAKNSAILLDKTADLVPPKAIVNSAQLEKELIRMFANAVMFNPMPRTERGFGPDVELTKGGVENNDDVEDDMEFKGYSNEEDSGSIIRDTREMMSNVEDAVKLWRDAEQGSIIFGEEFGSIVGASLGFGGGAGTRTGSIAGLTRPGSPGGENAGAGEDSVMTTEGDEGESEAAGSGRAGKRRRVVEN